jgi:hypothetical protein
MDSAPDHLHTPTCTCHSTIWWKREENPISTLAWFKRARLCFGSSEWGLVNIYGQIINAKTGDFMADVAFRLDTEFVVVGNYYIVNSEN